MKTITSRYSRYEILPIFLAEFLGTFLLMFLGCIGCVTEDVSSAAFSFGMIVMGIVHVFSHISKANFNPAVSIGMVIYGKLTWFELLIYLAAQYSGAFAGYLTLYLCVGESQKTVCLLKLNEEISTFQGFIIELIGTAMLLMWVGSLEDEANAKGGEVSAVKVGLAVTGLVYALATFTGAALNPARSLPPALLSNDYTNHWVFHAGPFAGGIIGALLYRFFFDSTEKYSLPKFFSQLCCGENETVQEVYE